MHGDKIRYTKRRKNKLAKRKGAKQNLLYLKQSYPVALQLFVFFFIENIIKRTFF